MNSDGPGPDHEDCGSASGSHVGPMAFEPIDIDTLLLSERRAP